jgi:hypothetical protein
MLVLKSLPFSVVSRMTPHLIWVSLVLTLTCSLTALMLMLLPLVLMHRTLLLSSLS